MSSRFCVHELQLPRKHGIPLYFLSLAVIACCFPRCRHINMHKINRKIGVSHHHCTGYCHHHASYPMIAFIIITSLPFATVHSTGGIMTISWLLMHGSLTNFQRPQHNILKCIAVLMYVPPLHFSCAALPAEVGDLLRRFISGPW